MSAMFKSSSLTPSDHLSSLGYHLTTYVETKSHSNIAVMSKCLAYLLLASVLDVNNSEYCIKFVGVCINYSLLHIVAIASLYSDASRDRASPCYIPHMMLTCAMGMKLASTVVFNGQILEHWPALQPSDHFTIHRQNVQCHRTNPLKPCNCKLLYHTKSGEIQEMSQTSHHLFFY